MSTLTVQRRTDGPMRYHQSLRLMVEHFDVSGFGEKGDAMILSSPLLFNLEIAGSILPFKWEQDGPKAVKIALAEKWRGYMLIPVIGIEEGR